MLIDDFDAKTFDKTKHCCACGSRTAPYKCSTGQYCEEHKRNAAEVMLWVPTYVKHQPYKANDWSDAVWHERRVMRTAQGRNSFDTEEESDAWVASVISANAAWRIEEIWGKDPQFKSLLCPHWPGSDGKNGDPKRTIFDAQ